MANALSEALLAVQDNIVRYPLVEIKAGQFADDLPLAGQRFDSETLDQSDAVSVTHSSGRLVTAYVQDDQDAYGLYRTSSIQLVYTDLERTEFLHKTILIDHNIKISDLAMVEQSDGKLALAYVEKNGSDYYLRCASFNLDASGLVIFTVLNKQSLQIYSPSIAKTATGYLLGYIQDVTISAASGGAYTGTTDSTINILVLTDGTKTTATFKWQKSGGLWSDPVTMTGTAQALTDGLTVTFGNGDYWAGQEFWFVVSAERYATGSVTATAMPIDGDTVVLGGTTYTFKSALSSPAVENEVLIDPLGMAITAENLRCAIMADAFEGSGAGVRYGTGTVANASATATRSDKKLTLKSISPGTVGNNITLTVDGARMVGVAFSGGLESARGAMQWTPSNKLFLTSATAISGAWSAPAMAAIGGVVATRKKLDTFLFRQSDGAIWLFFTYLSQGNSDKTAVYNLLYATSVDSGVSWSDAIPLTDFSSPTEIARRPVAAQKLATEIVIAFDSVKSSLSMRSDSESYWSDETGQSVRRVHFDPATRKLYASYGYNFIGYKVLYGIVRIDVDSWTIDRFWNSNTVPSIPLYFRKDHHVMKGVGSGHYVACAANDKYMILDDSSNTINVISGSDDPGYGVTKNINGLPSKNGDVLAIDATNKRLYVGVAMSYYNPQMQAGYIDFNGPEYSYTSLVSANSDQDYENFQAGSISVDLSNGYILFTASGNIEYADGSLHVFMLDGSGEIKKYRYSTNSAFPKYGVLNPVIVNNKVYAAIGGYTPLYGQGNYWGMISVDLTTDQVKVFPPSSILSGAARDAKIRSLKVVDSDKIVGMAQDDGVIVFDTVGETWQLINNDTVSGVFPNGIYFGGTFDYDPISSMIFVGASDPSNVFSQVVAFPLMGKIEQPQYVVADYSGGTWVLSGSSPLVYGFSDFSAALAVDPSTSGLYAFWTRRTMAEGIRVYWGKEIGLLDLTNDIVKDQKIEQKRTIDGTPGSVSFTLIKGHLYDPSNKASLLSSYLRKGKKILFRWGETINGVDHWQAGSSIYVVKTVRLTYKNGSYPKITVTAEDRTTLWDDLGIVASKYYAGVSPDAALSDLLQTHAGIEQTEIDLSVLSADDVVYYQWLDTDMKAAAETLCDRYGCYIDIGLSDNVVRARKLSKKNAIDHAYAEANLIDFTPDDSFSSYTNRITVKGEGRIDIDVETAEESVGGESGTLGFFCCNQTHRIWYSADHQLRAARPRLEITQNVSSIGFKMGGKMRQYISAVDPEGHWVEVTAHAPNLLPILISAIAAYMAADNMPPVITSGGPATSKTESRIKAAAMFVIMQCLSAVGNYSFEIYASPIGTTRQTFQATADDTELQNELRGTIIETVIDDPLVYDIAQAQQVADHDLWVVQAQRNRVKFQKVAHLQDDIGDTIVLPHPHTHANIKLIITNLTRTMYLPGSNGLGTITDSIEGWLL